MLVNLAIVISQCRLIDQRDTNGLANENTELKLRLQAMEQQAQLRNGKTDISTQKLIHSFCMDISGSVIFFNFYF